MQDKRLSFAFPSEMRKELEEIASKEGRTLSNIIRTMLMEGIKNRKIRKAKRMKFASTSKAF